MSSDLCFENTGEKFVAHELPIEAQFSPIYALAAVDIDGDQDLDIAAAGNESRVRVRIRRSDVNEGILLRNDGKAKFNYVSESVSGLQLNRDIRELLDVSDPGWTLLICGVIGETIKA